MTRSTIGEATSTSSPPTGGPADDGSAAHRDGGRHQVTTGSVSYTHLTLPTNREV